RAIGQAHDKIGHRRSLVLLDLIDGHKTMPDALRNEIKGNICLVCIDQRRWPGGALHIWPTHDRCRHARCCRLAATRGTIKIQDSAEVSRRLEQTTPKGAHGLRRDGTNERRSVGEAAEGVAPTLGRSVRCAMNDAAATRAEERRASIQ